MNKNTFVFSKDALTDTDVVVDITSLLVYGETLTSIAIQAISPQSDSMLIVEMLSAPTDPVVELLLKQGLVKTSYGFQLFITTSARQLTALVAVTLVDEAAAPYTSQDPEAYVDLVDSIEAGKGAIGTAVFPFPAGIDPTGGYVNWELLSSDGVVYANGNAFDYKIVSNGFSNIVRARAVINVPSTVPESDLNSKYQLRYTLSLDSVLPGQQSTYYSYENITVVGLSTVPTGVQDAIELKGNKATMSIVLDKLYDNVEVSLYQDNTLLGQTKISDFTRVASGYYYGGIFDTSVLTESLEPYSVIWNYGDTATPNSVFTENANLWIATPQMLSAIGDVKAKINKARTTLYGSPDLLFPPETIMLWLRRARDNFNGGPGGFTNFTFTNAKGAVREYWLMYAEMLAIEAQYMAEGEKAFNFAGAAITLDVDRTSYLDAAASKIQSRLDSEMKPFKQNLIIKGATGGDGSIDPSRLQRGALGSVGITITPASPWGPWRGNIGFPTAIR